MNIYDDYSEYMEEYQQLILTLKKSASPVYVLIEDVIIVTDYIWNEYSKGSKISDDLVEIFEAGFGYLSNIMGDLKIMYEEYFNKNIELFNYYGPLIVYSMYVEDYRCHLESQELLDDEKSQVIDELETAVDNILANSKPFTLEMIDEYDAKLINIMPKNDHFQPVYIVYSMIVEELNLI